MIMYYFYFVFVNTVFYPNLLASHTPELAKLIRIGQNNAAKLNDIVAKQGNLEKMINEQGEKINEQAAQISEILSLLKDHEEVYPKVETKGKGRGVERANIRTDEFYQVNIESVIYIYNLCTFFILTYNCLYTEDDQRTCL